MPGYENHAGFNISGSKLQVVEVNYENNQFRLVNVNETAFSQPINFDSISETNFSALLQSAFDTLQNKKRLNSKLVSFTLPFELFYTMQIPYDTSLLYQDLLEEFKWELSVLYPFISVNDLVIQYSEIDKSPFNDTNMALVFAIQRNYLKILDSFCKKNHLNLKFVDNLHIAAERSLSISNSIYYKGLTLSVYLDKKFISLFFVYNSKPLLYKVIPLNDYSEISDHLVRETSGSSTIKIERSQIEAAFISGLEIPNNLIPTLKKILGLDFILFNPFDKIRPIPELYESKLYLEKYNSFSSAAGIAFRIA
jgi:Tfp pilus assembly PilM family ATPase